MSKVEMLNGERLMTKQNALRHYVRLGRIALRSGDYDKMHKVWSDSLKEVDVDLCENCQEDDFGYCGLRRDPIDEKEKFMKHCFPSYLKAMEKELSVSSSRTK